MEFKNPPKKKLVQTEKNENGETEKNEKARRCERWKCQCISTFYHAHRPYRGREREITRGFTTTILPTQLDEQKKFMSLWSSIKNTVENDLVNRMYMRNVSFQLTQVIKQTEKKTLGDRRKRENEPHAEKNH